MRAGQVAERSGQIAIIRAARKLRAEPARRSGATMRVIASWQQTQQASVAGELASRRVAAAGGAAHRRDRTGPADVHARRGAARVAAGRHLHVRAARADRGRASRCCARLPARPQAARGALRPPARARAQRVPGRPPVGGDDRARASPVRASSSLAARAPPASTASASGCPPASPRSSGCSSSTPPAIPRAPGRSGRAALSPLLARERADRLVRARSRGSERGARARPGSRAPRCPGCSLAPFTISPRTGRFRRCAASSVSAAWLTVPRPGRQMITSGSPSTCARSAVVRPSPSGASRPDGPSTSTPSLRLRSAR